MRSTPLFIATLASAAAVLGAVRAEAAGFAIRENSAEGVATAFAGNASRADDASTVFNNPAGMNWLQGSQTEIGGVLILPSIHFNGGANVLGTPIPGSNGRNGGQTALVPHIYAVWDFKDAWRLGLAITVPFGNTVDYSEAWSGRYANLKTAALAADINPNISYRINDRLSVGGGVSLQYFKAELAAAIPQFLILTPTTPDGYYRLKGDDWGWGFNLGALAEPFDGTKLGVTYRSEVSHSIDGHLTFPGTSPLLGLVDSPAHTKVTLPASTTGSITQQIAPDFSLSSEVQYTQWSVFKNVTVTSANPTITFARHYKDSWLASVGGVYQLNAAWSLRAGLGWDQSPVRDAFRDPGVPDKDRYLVGAGFAWHVTPMTSLDGSFAHYFAAGHATMNESANSIDPLTGVVALRGRYDNHLDYVALTFRVQLQ